MARKELLGQSAEVRAAIAKLKKERKEAEEQSHEEAEKGEAVSGKEASEPAKENGKQVEKTEEEYAEEAKEEPEDAEPMEEEPAEAEPTEEELAEEEAAEEETAKEEYTGTDYTEEEYVGEGYTEDEYTEDEYTEEDYTEDDYTEDEYTEEDYTEDDYTEDDYTEDDYIEEEYVGDEYIGEEDITEYPEGEEYTGRTEDEDYREYPEGEDIIGDTFEESIAENTFVGNDVTAAYAEIAREKRSRKKKFREYDDIREARERRREEELQHRIQAQEEMEERFKATRIDEKKTSSGKKKRKKDKGAKDDVIISLEGVCKYYRKGIPALKDIDITIHRGEFVFIVGESGSGKSTLVRLLLRELKPSSGTIMVNGFQVDSMWRRKIPKLRRTLGVVFQDFRLLEDRDVYENVAFAQRIMQVPKREMKRNVPNVLQMVGLANKYDAMPAELSGGEQQRVAIARALVNHPPILLADEPTGNLDRKNTIEIMTLLDQINKEGTTVIVVTHDNQVVDDMPRRVIRIDKGVIVSDDERGD